MDSNSPGPWRLGPTCKYGRMLILTKPVFKGKKAHCAYGFSKQKKKKGKKDIEASCRAPLRVDQLLSFFYLSPKNYLSSPLLCSFGALPFDRTINGVLGAIT